MKGLQRLNTNNAIKMDVSSIDDAMLNNNSDETVEDLIAKLN
jgi:hypothetical protein